MTQTSTPASKTHLAAEIDVQVQATAPEHARIRLVATDDNPSHLATLAISERAAWALLKNLASTLGATILTEGQKQDLGLLIRETIAEADARKTGPAAANSNTALLNSMTDDMRDLRDTLRRAGVTD